MVLPSMRSTHRHAAHRPLLRGAAVRAAILSGAHHLDPLRTLNIGLIQPGAIGLQRIDISD
jgi:hypothetical protein